MGEEDQVEEMREGTEEEEPMPLKKPTNRKRSSKGAKNTKAPMDGEGGDCSCKKKRKGKYDGHGKKYGDGSYNKMDGLTAGYLRLDRKSKKCGGGWIPFNKKCRKGVSAKEKAAAKKEFKSITNTMEGARKFAGQKGKTKGLGNKVKAAGEFAAKLGGAAAIGAGYAQTITSGAKGNIGGVSRGFRTMSLGAAALQTANASKASRMGKKALRNEFLKSAARNVAVGVGQEAALGAYAGFKRTGGMAGMKRRARGAYQRSRMRRAGIRRYRDGGMYAKGFNVDYSRLAA